MVKIKIPKKLTFDKPIDKERVGYYITKKLKDKIDRIAEIEKTSASEVVQKGMEFAIENYDEEVEN